MTGEDMIIEAAAALLKEQSITALTELRQAFWIAGRCEGCGAPADHVFVKDWPSCDRCGALVVNRMNRAAVPPEPTDTQRLNMDVTDAIFRADHALDRAIAVWAQVECLEEKISETEKDWPAKAAERGVGRARLVIEILQTIRGRRS
jgi:hypothetical protein